MKKKTGINTIASGSTTHLSVIAHESIYCT
jgi:hypothetical protein